jgi:hypothetical protein
MWSSTLDRLRRGLCGVRTAIRLCHKQQSTGWVDIDNQEVLKVTLGGLSVVVDENKW